jgi:two-component system sensor histidine kinase DctS
VIPALVLLLLVVAIVLLLVLSGARATSEKRQQQVADALWLKQTIQHQLDRSIERIGAMAVDMAKETKGARLQPEALETRLSNLLHLSTELAAAGVIASDGRIILWLNRRERIAPEHISLYATELSGISRRDLIEAATRVRRPTFMPAYDGPHGAAFDVVVPIAAGPSGDAAPAFVLAVFSFQRILDDLVPWWLAQDNEVRLTDPSDTLRATRAVAGLGRGIFVHQSTIDLAGVQLLLTIDNAHAPPDWLAQTLRASVAVLTLLLAGSLWLLWSDSRRRLAAEAQLRDEHAFRKAIGDSLVTGLRARDMQGRVSYVNPAFCEMVGYSADELIGQAPPMPYWAPEYREQYEERLAQIRAGAVGPQGFETVFQKRSGARFPVLIYDAPLLDARGRQTGWMSSIVDLSDQKRREELTRLQQERLQTAARLTTMGEIASSLAHELNQPLAAIRSYLVGSLNLLEAAPAGAMEGHAVEEPNLHATLRKADVQAERAGRIIRRVHDFVRRHDPQVTPVDLAALIQEALPLIELQTRKSGVRVVTRIDPQLPAVAADRVALEQVLLNLTRNAIEAMADTPAADAVLTLSAQCDGADHVAVEVRDRGCGIPADVGEQLFRPFFTTKSEGMGMGLSICRTVIESHGGHLTFAPGPDGGTVFRFTLPRRQNAT